MLQLESLYRSAYRKALPLSIALGTLAWLGCSESPTEPAARADGFVRLSIDVRHTTLADVTVTVDADDLAEPIFFTLPVTGGLISGTLRVPAGPDRSIRIRGTAAGGAVVYRGEAILDVEAGASHELSIALERVSDGFSRPEERPEDEDDKLRRREDPGPSVVAPARPDIKIPVPPGTGVGTGGVPRTRTRTTS